MCSQINKQSDSKSAQTQLGV